MNRIFALLGAVLFSLAISRAEGPDEQYIRIYQVIQEADRLNGAGQSRAAAAKYLEAQDGLRRFQSVYPGWNDRIVTFRLNYVATKLAPLTTSILATAQTNASPSSTSAAPASTSSTNAVVALRPSNLEIENQIKSLQTEIERLQADNRLLGAKLKEALSVQPAAVDPRELAKADERIRALLKENELLKAHAATKSVAPPPQATLLVQDTNAIQELNGKLAQQIDAANGLRSENELLKTQTAELQKKNQELIAAAGSSMTKEKVEELLAARDAKLAQQTEVAAALRTENELLKTQTAELQTKNQELIVAGGSSMTKDKVEQLLAARDTKLAEQIDLATALRRENESLKTQTGELQKKNQELTTAVGSSLSKGKAEQELAARDVEMRQLSEDKLALEKERALLKQLLEQRDQQLNTARNAKSEPVAALSPELDVLRARIEALEAKPLPYTREELALMAKPEMALSAPASPAPANQILTPPPAEGVVSKPAPAKKASRDIPSGAGALVTAAERAFAVGNYADAERKYVDVLRQDQENIRILADLASTQVQLGRLDEAEKNVRKALSLAPDDYFSLYVLGRIKFEQSKIDEAFDALSRSAKLNPDYAETQNYLGIVLSEKGLRAPAEAALRKAIQLQPNHAAAHNNLAVVYATQKPPALALARWHYQKAIAAGHQKNPELEKLLEQKIP